ncbi:MAG: MBL fold metallo-hydrolase [Proteobacteria bacterium]|nr:MBL fold metallo-hydrolase [Pseudomonadota bacterium]
MKPQKIGAYEITRVAEIDRMGVDPKFLFGNVTPEIIAANRGWLGPVFIEPDDKLVLSFHTFVIRTKHHVILVDTCNGNDKRRPSMMAWDGLKTPYLENLAAAGVRPEDVDYVMCTHLHTDHVGWNTRLVDGKWVPTFPRAKYLMAKTEFDYFNTVHQSNPPQPVNRGSFIDSVLPIVEHGRAVMVDTDHVLEGADGNGIWLVHAPGHTPGGVQIRVGARDRLAVLSGDIIHHPLQLAEPTLSNPADVDPAVAVKTKLKLMNECADSGLTLLTGHFPDPTAGQVTRHGERFRFRFQGD